MKRFVLPALTAAALLFAGYAVRPVFPEETRPPAPSSLHDAWKEVVGRQGLLRQDEKGSVFAVSLKDKVGATIVQSVGSDCVVLTGMESGPKWYVTLPLDRVELQVFR